MIRQENVQHIPHSVYDSEIPKYATFVAVTSYGFGGRIFLDKQYSATMKHVLFFSQPHMLNLALKRYEKYLNEIDGVQPDELVVKLRISEIDGNKEIIYDRFYGVNSIKEKLKRITYAL